MASAGQLTVGVPGWGWGRFREVTSKQRPHNEVEVAQMTRWGTMNQEVGRACAKAQWWPRGGLSGKQSIE